MYIRSSKTANIDAKKQLLLETRAILQSILQKYPDVEIAGKVKDNLARVEEGIRAIDPQLLLGGEIDAITTGDEGIDDAFARPVLPPRDAQGVGGQNNEEDEIDGFLPQQPENRGERTGQ